MFSKCKDLFPPNQFGNGPAGPAVRDLLAGVNPSPAHSKEEVSMLRDTLTGSSVAEIGIGEDLVYFHWLIKDYSLFHGALSCIKSEFGFP